MAENDDPRMDRRRFFREGLRGLFGKVEKATEPVQRFARELGKLDPPVPSPAPTPQAPNASAPGPARPVTLALPLRPPGALPEADFLAACTKCGECLKACPAQCIVTDESVGGGFPAIVAERKPCVVCDSLACMEVCPTGALQVVPRFAIRMGKAVWGEGKCLRGDGDDCRLCLDVCPMGTAAIDVSAEGGIAVKDACTGCGQCQHVCPTTPRAIVVVPPKG